MHIYAQERAAAGFESSVEAAIEAILVSLRFLFMAETPPPAGLNGCAYAVSDFDLATRLALLLWCSVSDARLLALAEQSKLRTAAVHDAEIGRMLAAPKAEALTKNFAGHMAWSQ